MSQSSSRPVYTISVGTAGEYTNDMGTNIAPLINAEISAAPTGSEIDLIFNPGNYGLASPIFLPSNTNVIGNNATLTGNGLISNQGLLVNKDAYFNGPWLQDNLTNGTSYGLWTYTSNDTSGTSTEPPSLNAIIDQNISVQGMNFVLQGGWTFGTWFTNCQNIDVQNNTYVGGVDGNAFVNVVNSVVSNNIGIGQINAAYDNWDGPVNISIQNNSAYMNGGWSVLLNSTPTGDPSNPGNAINDNITGNNFSTSVQNSTVLNANSLLSYGFTFEQNITEQGNIISLNNVPGNMAVYSADPMYNMLVQQNLVSGTNSAGANFSGAIYVVDSGANPTTTPSVNGNLIVGSNASPGVSSLVVMGTNVSAIDNALLGADALSVATVSTYNIAGNGTVQGNVANSGGTVIGTPLIMALSIEAPPTEFMFEDTSISLSGVELISGIINDTLSLTLSSVFGTISDTVDQNVISQTSAGVEMIVISGSAAQLNNELKNITYQSDAQGWDDSIQIHATDSSGLSATRYVPVHIESSSLQSTSIMTLTSQEFSSNATLTYPGALTGGAIVASSGDSLINMDGTISVVMLGVGENTVIGGSENGYISGGSGYSTLDLTGGGDITVAGGTGGLDVNASTGNDIIQPGAGGGNIVLGSGNSSVYGGLGNFNVSGGNGNVYVASLPENGGNFNVSLNSGSGTIFALSGNDSIETNSQTNNLMYLGLGSSTVRSGGNDTIYSGVGDTTIDASSGGNDTIFGGIGSLYFIGGSGNTIIDPAGANTVIAGSGNLKILPGQNLMLEINSLSGATRNINVYGAGAQIDLSGFSNDPISSQFISNGTINIELSDGSNISLADMYNQRAIYNNGSLSLSQTGAMPNTAMYNLDNKLGTGANNNSAGAIISSLIQNTPSGNTVILVSSGLQCNGVIAV